MRVFLSISIFGAGIEHLGQFGHNSPVFLLLEKKINVSINAYNFIDWVTANTLCFQAIIYFGLRAYFESLPVAKRFSLTKGRQIVTKC